MVDGSLSGKLVLVTGGAKNVGKAIAMRFAERGAHVIVNFFHSLEASKETAAELRAMGVEVDVIRASVAQKNQVDRMFDEIAAKYGRLDILVNNAASGALLCVDDIAEEHFDKALSTNLKGAFWCSRRAASLMGRGGAIVNVSSVGATLVPANYLVVGTSKAALESLTRYLAVEYAPRGIRVNTASATLIDGSVAEMFPNSESTKRSSIAATPLKRLAAAEDLADLVLFLASDSSRWITGQVVVADGGLSLCSEGLSPRTELTAAAAESLAAPFIAERAASSKQAQAPAQGLAEAPDDTDEIAIVGMGLALPGANDPQEFWRTLLEGPELFGNVPPDRWDYQSFFSPDASAEDKSYQSRSVFITGFEPLPRLQEELDAGVAPTELTTLWLRHALMQALEGVQIRDDDRVSFFAGYTADGSQHLEEAMVLAGVRSRLQAVLAEGDAPEEERRRCFATIDRVLSARYGRGASGFAEFLPHRVGRAAMRGVLPDDADYMMVDTACSSSLYSMDLGIKGLLLGKHDVVACGGAFALAPRGSVLFSKLHGLSKSGEARPLDKACDGVLFSDGAGVVILKRLKRALADGDRVLGVVKAFGCSSDGKGKAIYAPSSEGQNIAIRRAYERPGTAIGQVDWVVAHATGTPAGDLAEFQSLRHMFVADAPVQVTSNKSLIGHTGWAAGVASVIQVLLALQHSRIPPQHRFAAAPADFNIEGSGLRIPTAPIDWKRKPSEPRTAAVSGFGFGGTNGHLVISEYRADLPTMPARLRDPSEPLVIVGWSAKLPGLDGADAVRDWLLGVGTAPLASFGDSYPLPPFNRVQMPPAVLRAIDRCQLMALDAANDLRDQVRAFWDAHHDAIGVVMGHMGPTRNASLYASRCYLDDIAAALDGEKAGSDFDLIETALAGLRERTKRLVATSTENSFPGMMPNVIPARIANYFDLHGPNMTIDTGRSSALAAFDVAAGYLRSGELDMVIVGGINGNTADEIHPALDVSPAEGLVLFAVMTQARAEASGLSAIARIDAAVVTEADAARNPGPSLCDRSGRPVSFLAADGAIAVLRAVLAQTPGETVVAPNDGDRMCFGLRVAKVDASAPMSAANETGPAPRADSARIVGAVASSVRPSGPSSAAADAAAEISAPSAAMRPPLPEGLRRTDIGANGEPLGLKRYRIHLEEMPWRRGADPIAFLPARCVLVTDEPQLLDQLGILPADLVVLSTRPLTQARQGWRHIAAANEKSLAGLIPTGACHVRILSSLSAAALSPGQFSSPAPALLAVHDLAFLALKQCYDALGKGGSFTALLLDALSGDALHPDAGLFSGLVKAMMIELPSCRSLGVFTDSKEAREAIWQAERESGAAHLLPVVALRGARRLTPRVKEAPGDLPADGAMRLGPNSVVVAFGGARGITAEAMKAVARHIRPTIYLVGSTKLAEPMPDVLDCSDEEFARKRPHYIREQRALDPALSMPQINKAYDRLINAREARRNIEEMRKHCGADRVHYLCADVLDAASIQNAIAAILAREAQVDLVVNAAGLSRTASVPVKSFNDFLAVRDIKVRGYWNLRAAFGARQPRSWCNFGSFIGLTGQSGETDYASGNDFLNTQAAYHRGVLGANEFTMGWTLWQSVGMGSNPVTRAFLEKSGLFTSMPTEEGVHHFLREINLGEPDAATVYLGDAERSAIIAHLPSFFEAPAPYAAAAAPMRDVASRVQSPGFYLGRELARGTDEATFERVFDLDADAYLQHHVVNGFATLPGTFVPEIAAEAALQLLPGSVVVGFEDAVFHHFLRVYDARRPSVKKIHAQVLRRGDDCAVVQVRVTGDVVAPSGQVLVRDKLHFEIKALMAGGYEPAPVWASWPDAPHTPVADPYHFDAAPVRLTGVFVSTEKTRSAPLGKRARFSLDLSSDDPVFSRFVVPTILLDGLARIAVLNHVAENYIPLAAPASIRRIDIYESGNDCILPKLHESIELYATPREFALEGAGSRNRFVATRPDGRMLIQMKDVSGVIIGYVHRDTGAFVAKAEVDAILAGGDRREGFAA
ncbi:SDR family oxidoreductase [Methylocapsa aurea]|uniref:SDR family oxidoreductase n=1 Tax=Methylocapsa aurea TaxID=663610 RepID=UPI0005666D9B|nr:SDR family oxidoreductase [Methylocapsa aurea]